MAQFYVNKVKMIRQKQKTTAKNSMKPLKDMMAKKNCSFQLKEVTESEVVKAMKNMKNSKSLGPDEVQADLLKLTMNWTKKAIQTIVNLSIKERKFSEK